MFHMYRHPQKIQGYSDVLNITIIYASSWAWRKKKLTVNFYLGLLQN